MKYLTIGTLWKNEDIYALDFIKYHRKVGVEHFIIYDRNYHSLADLLKNEPDVEVVHFPESETNVHAQAWGSLIGRSKGKTKWLALIDADQAIVPVQFNNVPDILKQYEQYASLQLNWHTFGSAGKVEKGEGSLYERFLMRAKADEGINNHTQFICQPDRTEALKTHDPHHPRLPGGQISVNTAHQRIEGPFAKPPVHNVAYIAHYINKSKDEFAVKNGKGRADIFGENMPKNMFELHDAICNVEEERRVLDLWNI